MKLSYEKKTKKSNLEIEKIWKSYPIIAGKYMKEGEAAVVAYHNGY